jgi:4-hydroxymandelate synthase
MGASVADIGLAYVEFYVGDAEEQAAFLVERYGFRVVARSLPADTGRRSVALGQGAVRFVLTEGRRDTHPATVYVGRHGDGVANIAVTAADARAAFTEAVARGAVPAVATDGHGATAIRAFGDIVHTFVERPRGADWFPPGLSAVPGAEETDGTDGTGVGLLEVDHFAVCVPPGELGPAVRYYETALGFDTVFEEHILVGAQAMNSKVVQSRSQQLTFTIIEPDTTREPGQIDEFVERHDGAGIQHIAFSTANVVAAVGALRDRGVAFLDTPSSYYELLPHRIDVSAYEVGQLRDLDILVDADHAGQLFQIFARSTHPRHTFFFEVIERLGAETFGSGNIKALYEAVESERLRSRDVVG